MNPSHVIRRIANAEAVSHTMREVARECTNQPALAARWLQGAQTIDELVSLLKQSQFVAKLNHDTIVAGAGS